MYSITMTAAIEAESQKKALTYTAIICGILLLLAILITWKIFPPPTPIVQDLIEINLGNYDMGDGLEQPLIKGEMSAQPPVPEQQNQATATVTKEEEAQDVEENDDKDAAPIVKPEKVTNTKNVAKAPVTKPVKNPTPTPAVTPAPKPQKPKFTYQGPGGGNGNNATEDNGYRNQGNNPNGKGDYGDPTGKPDSYGNTPGGKSGGMRVIKGDRKIVNRYIFMGDLPKATINAIIKVSPEGRGTFVGFDKNSTTTDPRYANAIRNYLPNIQFDKSDHESVVTVSFNFTVQ